MASYVYSGKTVSGVVLGSGGSQFVSSGGSAVGTRISAYGSQYVYSGGSAVSTTIFSGGYQDVYSGGVTLNVSQLAGGNMYAGVYGGNSRTKVTGTNENGAFNLSNGVAKNFIVYAGGEQYVASGGSAVGTTISSGGDLYVASGGVALNVNQIAGGNVEAGVYGGNSRTRVVGTNEKGAFSLSKGVAKNFAVYAGGSQWVDSGGSAVDTTIFSGGVQYVDGGAASSCTVGANGVQDICGGTAYNTVIKPRGMQFVASGKALGTVVSKGGSQIVSSSGKVVRTSVMAGGELFVFSDGKAVSAFVSSGGIARLHKGGKTTALTVKSGGTLYLSGGVLSGVNTFSGAAVNIMAAGVKIDKIKANSATKLNYNISKVKAGVKAMLIESVKQKPACAFSITTAKAQQIGAYKLSASLDVTDNTVFNIKLGEKSLGSAKLNGTAFTRNGVTYKVTDDSAGTVSLTLSMKAGVMRKGTAGADTLTGGNHSDIFYGGRGKDTISGKNGRDVAVYDKNAWGRDTIMKTNGTMTIVLAGVKKKAVTTSLSNKGVMTITRNADTAQKISVQGWNDATHNIVYADTLTEFSKYVKAASPTTAQAKAARNEVWQKAGLAAGT